MSDDSSITMQRVDDSIGPMKEWLNDNGFFRDAEDNYDAWRLVWETHDGTRYVVRGNRSEDPVTCTYKHIRKTLLMLCTLS